MQLQLKDLRTGNIVARDTGMIILTAYDIYEGFNGYNFKPVTLTTKILKDMGFTPVDIKIHPGLKFTDIESVAPHRPVRFYWPDSFNETHIHINAGQQYFPKITNVHFVHQFQNVIFFLSGKEFTLSDEFFKS